MQPLLKLTDNECSFLERGLLKKCIFLFLFCLPKKETKKGIRKPRLTGRAGITARFRTCSMMYLLCYCDFNSRKSIAGIWFNQLTQTDSFKCMEEGNA